MVDQAQRIVDTEYFRQLKQNSLNGLQNSAQWQVDRRQQDQVKAALTRLNADLDEGILLKLRLQREKQLAQQAVKDCYQRSDLNILQAGRCE